MKLNRLLFYLFLLFLPSQLAYHFWPNFSFVNGIRIDYLSPTIFFTDILFFIVIGIWIYKKNLTIRNLKLQTVHLVILLFVAMNILLSLSPISTLFHWLRILQVLLLYKYVRGNNIKLQKIITPLSIVIVITSLLAVGQVFTGRNLGGVLYWLGERPLNINQPGVSLFSINGISYLRPYATFPHPNALAGYAGLAFLTLLTSQSKQLMVRIALVASLIIITLAFSQSTWIALILAFVTVKIYKPTIIKIFTLFVFFSLISPLLIHITNLSLLENNLSISQRIDLIEVAGKVIANFPILGTGLGQFVRTIPHLSSQNIWWLQPVHNIPLLIASEFGLIGMTSLFILFRKYLSAISINHYPLIIFVIVTSLVDHYWLTSHQNLLLLPIIFGTIKNE